MCCKEKKIAAKDKYIKGCQILAKIATCNTRKLRAFSNSNKKLRGCNFYSSYMKGMLFGYTLVY